MTANCNIANGLDTNPVVHHEHGIEGFEMNYAPYKCFKLCNIFV